MCYANFARLLKSSRREPGKVLQMRPLILFLLPAALVWSDALASEVDEGAFRYELGSYLHNHPLRFPADLMDRHTEGHATVTFSIDRDGKLLDAKMASGSGSTKADQDILDWITHLQPFPKVPADLSAPVKYSEEIVLVPPNLVSDLKIKWAVHPGASATEAAFRNQVADHLQHIPRTYTSEMKASHDKRRTVVALSIDRSGKLLNVELIKAFGSQTIDQETLAWLAAAQPYPPIPPDLEAPLELNAEFEFGPPREGIWNDDKVERAVNNVCKGC